MKRGLIAIFAVLLGYLLLWPVPIDPIAWEAPVFDASAWKPSGTLAGADRVGLDGVGPEDVELDAQGRIYTGLLDGRILRYDDPHAVPTVFVNTGGRPLGMGFDQKQNLIVADALRGLARVAPSGDLTVLTTTCAGAKLGFTDDLDIATDGTIYFSDASMRFGVGTWRLDIMESQPLGRLCAWDPRTYQTREVLAPMYFPNGVALDPQQQFVLVNETSRYRVRKIWIDGEKKGQEEMLIENLPGFPDNLSTGTNGAFWIALVSPRNQLLDSMAGLPIVRKIVFRLPEFLQPGPERTARALAVDANGRVLADLFDPKGEKITMVTSVEEAKGELFFGSLSDTGFAHQATPAR